MVAFAGTHGKGAVCSLSLAFFQYDINNAALGIRIVFGGRVVDDFDPVDAAGRDAIQLRRAVDPGNTGDAAVDQRHRRPAPQRDLAVGADQHTGHVLQQVGSRTADLREIARCVNHKPLVGFLNQFFGGRYLDGA